MYSLYLALGSFLFGFYRIHLILILLTACGWIIFKGRCRAQIEYNKICNIDEKSSFVDIQNVIFNRILKIKGTAYKWPLVIIIILFDIYYIKKGK